MVAPLTRLASPVQGGGRPWILIAAYDVSTGESSEGHVAFNILRRLCKTYRIVLITRRNNKARLEVDRNFADACPGVRLVGYDLPKWASWWKYGARFYEAYAYLWQMTCPLALRGHTRLLHGLRLIHVLNFHNDSIPSLAWRLRLPVVWGPINHNEIVPAWRREFWPRNNVLRHLVAFTFRRVLWQIDPFLRLHICKSDVVLSAGKWVDRRLNLSCVKTVIRRSQLGVSETDFSVSPSYTSNHDTGQIQLICAGRLDWIKGLDLAIEALSHLPAQFHLRIIGKGPSEARLRALVMQLGLERRVMFHPPAPRSSLSVLYAHADLFLFTSAEVGGLAWVEALASGLPVVAFDGLTEVTAAAHYLPGIHLATAMKTRHGHVVSLASAIRSAALVPRDPIAISAAALAHYGWDGLASIINDAYSGAIGSMR
jgi:glycosyltransferase involved in cell wall biosynthesis